jgi:hypothetical protein
MSIGCNAENSCTGDPVSQSASVTKRRRKEASTDHTLTITQSPQKLGVIRHETNVLLRKLVTSLQSLAADF